jgi:hypothetical protein
MRILPRNFLHSRQTKILELRIQVHQYGLAAGRRIDGSNARRCVHALIKNNIRQGRRCRLLRGTRFGPCLTALSKVRLWGGLSSKTVNPPNIAGNIARLGVPGKEPQVLVAYFDELAAGNLEFHQESVRLSQRQFRPIINIQR